MRDRAWRREQRERCIRRRRRIINSMWVWIGGKPYPWPSEAERGRLAKGGLICSCRRCRYYRYLERYSERQEDEARYPMPL